MIFNRQTRLAVAAWLSVLAAVVGCGTVEDGDDTGIDDDVLTDDDNWFDDDNDNDSAAPDDDEEDQHEPGTCEDVAHGMINICGTTLVDLEGNEVDEAGLADWCDLSDEIDGGTTTRSHFWNCLDIYVSHEACDPEALTDCLDPPAPGTLCGDVMDGIYACGIVWVFEGNLYWIPEMDAQATCETWSSYTTRLWECWAECLEVGCDDLLDCLNTCPIDPTP
jgi:hypothetical protein